MEVSGSIDTTVLLVKKPNAAEKVNIQGIMAEVCSRIPTYSPYLFKKQSLGQALQKRNEFLLAARARKAERKVSILYESPVIREVARALIGFSTTATEICQNGGKVRQECIKAFRMRPVSTLFSDPTISALFLTYPKLIDDWISRLTVVDHYAVRDQQKYAHLEVNMWNSEEESEDGQASGEGIDPSIV